MVATFVMGAVFGASVIGLAIVFYSAASGRRRAAQWRDETETIRLPLKSSQRRADESASDKTAL